MRLVSVPNAAKEIGVSHHTIRRRVSAGQLTGYRLGSRILRVDLDELLASLHPVPSAVIGDAPRSKPRGPEAA